MAVTYNYGTGRRKSAVARVFMKKGTGSIVVNGKPVDEFFSRETGRMIVRQPLVLTNFTDNFDILVNVTGDMLYGVPSSVFLDARERGAPEKGRPGYSRCP